MTPQGEVYVGGTTVKENVAFPGGINFITDKVEGEKRIEEIEFENPESAILLQQAMTRVAEAGGVQEVRLKVHHVSKGANMGDVFLDGEKVEGTGYETDPVSPDLINY